MLGSRVEIDPRVMVVGSKLAALMNDVLGPIDLDVEQYKSAVTAAISSGLCSKDERPRLSDEEREAKAEDAEAKARIYSSVRNWLDTNPPPDYNNGDRSTCKTIPELISAMNIPRVERTPRLTAILRTVLLSSQTDWGMVAKIDGITLYGARPRLLQYAA